MAQDADFETKTIDHIVDREIHHDPESQDGLWLRFLTYLKWYPNNMPHAEKKLILKLDFLILVFGCLSFFTKYLDQQAMTNAYVSYVSIQEFYYLPFLIYLDVYANLIVTVA